MSDKEKIVIGKNFKYDPYYVSPLEDAITVLSKYESERKSVTDLDDDLDIIISLDTNLLLSYYQYSITDRTTLMEFYQKNNKRIYITNWVEKEFVSQFYSKIKGLKNQFETFHKEVNNNFNAILDNITKIEKHHYLNSEYIEKSEEIKKIDEEIKLQIKKKKGIIENIEYKEYEGIDKDNFLKIIRNIAKSEETTKEEFDIIYNQYIDIIKSGFIIPGAKKKDQQKGKFPHGDFIIFYELLKLSKQKEKDIIFITNDTSDNDWLDKNNNISTAYLFNAYHLTNGHLIYILPASVIKAIPKLEILVPNSDVEEKAEIISKWVGSKYLGAMSWDKGMLQARKLGMRLPTYNEFREAFGLGIIADWNEIDGDGFYWTSEVNSVDFFETLVTLFDVDGGGVAYNYKDFHSHVRCIR